MTPKAHLIKKNILNITIHQKIIGLFCLVVMFFMALVFFWLLPTIKNTLIQEKRIQLENLIAPACCYLTSIYAQEKDGSLSREEAQRRARERIKNMKYGPEGKDYFWIIDFDHKMVMHPFRPDLEGKEFSKFKDPLGKALFVEMVQVCRDKGQGFVEYVWQWKDDPKRIEPKLSFVKAFGPWNWIVGTGLYVNDITSQIAGIRNRILLVVVPVSVLLTFGLHFLISRLITRPLIKAVHLSSQVAAGDLTHRLQLHRQDEIGDLSQSLNDMSDSLARMLFDVSQGVSTLASSSTELATISRQMTASTQETSGRTHTVSAAAEEMSLNMTQVAAAMEQTSASVSAVAMAAEKMSATINQIATNSEQARSITLKATSRSSQASQRMETLGQAAQEITDITRTITDISDQTNLLALNATIEAARAGEAGRGFAVVAHAIKALAQQATTASEEIRQKIDGIQMATTSSINEIAAINEVIKAINDNVGNIATAVEEQSVTTREIADNVTQASQGVRTITENVAQNSMMARDVAREVGAVNHATVNIANGSGQVHGSSTELFSLAEKLQDTIANFKV